MSIAQNLIQVIQEEMLKAEASVLRSVRLNIGKMCSVVPDALSFCFEVIVAGTTLEGARLIMDTIPLRGHCPGCDKEFDIEDYVFVCPYCRNPAIEVISGQDLTIVEIEVE
jgi:hydrogenase nickel incorporation protein HypA/HybF